MQLSRQRLQLVAENSRKSTRDFESKDNASPSHPSCGNSSFSTWIILLGPLILSCFYKILCDTRLNLKHTGNNLPAETVFCGRTTVNNQDWL